MDKENLFTGVNSIKFNKYFQGDNDCYRYLAESKRGNFFVCRKCVHTKYYNGAKPYSRRCLKCKYDERPTAGTMFDKRKFPLLITFHTSFKISTKKKGMSSMELSWEFELRQMTCWEFKWKMQQAMQRSCNYSLKGIVRVDGLYIGGQEEGSAGEVRVIRSWSLSS